MTLAASVSAAAQAEQQSITLGAVVNDGEVRVGVAPAATLLVRLDFECEEFKAGEYARYAQKYLGRPANLLDKRSYTISSASVAKAAADYFIADESFTKNCVEVVEQQEFTLPINITSSAVNTPEKGAELAAEEIFYIRNTRREILAGEFGEGFYGGGLGAALAQFQREEDAYSNLFYGSMRRVRESRVFNISLVGETQRYIVCRFSEASGVVDNSDLSAEAVTLQITPLELVEIKTPSLELKATYTDHNLLIATQVKVDLLFGGKVIATRNMPLYEFGREVVYPVKNEVKR